MIVLARGQGEPEQVSFNMWQCYHTHELTVAAVGTCTRLAQVQTYPHSSMEGQGLWAIITSWWWWAMKGWWLLGEGASVFFNSMALKGWPHFIGRLISRTVWAAQTEANELLNKNRGIDLGKTVEVDVVGERGTEGVFFHYRSYDILK